MKPTLGEVLALDLVCLRAPDGGPIDPVSHKTSLAASLDRSRWALVRRCGDLVAYGYLWPHRPETWFVGGLAIHPDHRNAAVTAELGRQMSALVRLLGAKRLESHVLRTNVASLRLHRRLGFEVDQESERAIAFVADTAALLHRLPV